jgi:hypothetical protein
VSAVEYRHVAIVPFSYQRSPVYHAVFNLQFRLKNVQKTSDLVIFATHNEIYVYFKHDSAPFSY